MEKSQETGLERTRPLYRQDAKFAKKSNFGGNITIHGEDTKKRQGIRVEGR
jgi:hypothetical protein